MDFVFSAMCLSYYRMFFILHDEKKDKEDDPGL